MAAATPNTLNSIDAILKDHYAGPVRDQLNNEMMIFDLFTPSQDDLDRSQGDHACPLDP